MTLPRHVAFVYDLLVLGAVLAGVADLRAQQNTPSQFRVAGTVVNRQDGTALDRVRVILRNVKDLKDVQSVLTGEDGRFEFRTNAGKYALHGAKRGFISSDYDQHEQYSTAIVTGAEVDTENLALKLAPSAVLGGRVLDESGEPVRDATVLLWREDHMTGVSRISRFRQQNSDDLGTYEFAPLDAGTYYLSVNANPWYAVHPQTFTSEGTAVAPAAVDASLDVVYPTTYYSSALESDAATPIAVEGGEHPELDVRLTPVPALHLLFRSPGGGEQAYGVPVLQKRAFDGFDRPLRWQPPVLVAPGISELVAPPGKYEVRVYGAGQNGRVVEADLTEDRQEIDSTSGEAVSTVKASVRVLGEGALPKEVFVVLRDAKHRVTTGAEVTGNGEVDLGEIAPGSYEVVAGSRADSFSVVRIGVNGQETSGHTLHVPAGTALSVTLSMLGGSARVVGFARHSGKPVAGAMVVLVPKHPGSNVDQFRRDQSDLDGSFSLSGVIPGAYTVTAIDDGWKLDWSRPEVISKYAAHGTTIVVPAEKGEEIQLPEALEVQAR
jgi:hypothetical protein